MTKGLFIAASSFAIALICLFWMWIVSKMPDRRKAEYEASRKQEHAELRQKIIEEEGFDPEAPRKTWGRLDEIGWQMAREYRESGKSLHAPAYMGTFLVPALFMLCLVFGVMSLFIALIKGVIALF